MIPVLAEMVRSIKNAVVVNTTAYYKKALGDNFT